MTATTEKPGHVEHGNHDHTPADGHAEHCHHPHAPGHHAHHGHDHGHPGHPDAGHGHMGHDHTKLPMAPATQEGHEKPHHAEDATA
ncbi:hypothetical protein HY374_00505 [Candidatus Berkelbacteria bacterium]|nr:hypothetical protein [Candidatus Berkelbacteria bacterium]